MKLPWNNEAEFYNLHSKQIFSEFPFYHLSMIGNTKEEFLNYIINSAKINSKSRVVDLGCGSGYVADSLNRLCECTGISTSQECVNQAKINYPNANIKIANMETFSNKNSTHFLALESMGYSDAGKTFKNVYKNLEKDGIFYIKDACKKNHENYKEKESSFNDVSDIMNNSMYMESSKHHKVRFDKMPHENVDFINAVEFIFMKQ